MEFLKPSFFLLAILSFCTPSLLMGRARLLVTESEEGDPNQLTTYIIHVQKPEGVEFATSEDREKWHTSFLPVSTATSVESRMVYSYSSVISGFAARLTHDELKAIEEMDGFVHAYPERVLAPHTTHTPQFLGLDRPNALWGASNLGKGVIIGMVDTGIFAGHPSFRDDGIPPPPSKWKGRCDLSSGCNNKLIGARVFDSGMRAMSGGGAAATPIDDYGHGTHTASTAAGNFVKDANVLGMANGMAVGMAPYSHLSIYKVCFGGCAESDILAGIDQAIDDGVDVLSISLGGPPRPYHDDSIAIGSLAAIEKGVLVSCSAGNDGPFQGTVTNDAPWILTVGASTIDRSISAVVKLGNGEEFNGESAYQPEGFSSTLHPAVFPGALADYYTATCSNGSLDSIDVKGKVVLCIDGGFNTRIQMGEVVKKAGGAAMIVLSQDLTTFAVADVLPASQVSNPDAVKILNYVNSSSMPTATIVFKGTVIGTPMAPMVASFSSRGPSTISPSILKPDIIGPGVNILAAWPFPVGPPSSINPAPLFNFLSGTSMSTPHLSGIAALIKHAHPEWSPAAIRSAIMTTSDTLNHDGEPIVDYSGSRAGFFEMGAGHVNPVKASDPGLVYDLAPEDYIPYLCGLGYTDPQVGVIARRPIKCSNLTSISGEELNYPSITVSLGSTTKTITRTVTNVDEADSAYSVEIDAPKGVSVSVSPENLYFSEASQKATFKVTFSVSGSGGSGPVVSEGHLMWVSKKYVVRSPVTIMFIEKIHG